KPKSEKQGTVWSHGPLVRPHESLGAFRDEFCPHPHDCTVPSCDRAGTKSKLHILLSVRPHGVPCDRTVPSGRIKIKAKIGISSFRARSKPL
ncbi:hypothetical protein PIB30_087222, partial [Stylosanthes scabra]|nr:hypothetical protein [Stylosanthes scabra]